MNSSRQALVIFLFVFYCFQSIQLACIGASSSKEEEEEFLVAKNAFEEGFYDTSAKLFNGFAVKYPQSPLFQEAGLYIGQCYFYQRNYAEAITRFSAMLTRKNAEYLQDKLYFWIAETHFKNNDFLKAYQWYTTVVTQYPESSYHPQALYSMGWCLFQQDKFGEAKEQFLKVKEKFPKNVLAKEADFKIVECFYNLKEYAKLKEYLGALVPEKNFSESQPERKNALLRFYLAESCYYLQDYGCALANYSDALAASDDRHFAGMMYLGLGWSYLKLNEYVKAKEIFHNLQENQENEKTVENALLGEAIALQMAAQFRQSLEVYAKILARAKSPQALLEAFLGKAEILYHLENYDEAIAVYKEAERYLNAESNDASIERLHFGLGSSYLKAGKQNDGLHEFSSLVDNAKDEEAKVSRLVKLADVFSDLGNTEKAAALYERIIKEHPGSHLCGYAQYRLGIQLFKEKRYARAIEIFKALPARYPQSEFLEEAEFYLVKAYYESGDFSHSYSQTKEFINQYPSSALIAGAILLEGASLKSLKRFQEAYDFFKAIVHSGADMYVQARAEFEMIDCLYYLNRKDEFLEKLELLRSKYPDSEIIGSVLFRLAEYYFSENECGKSRRYLLELITNKMDTAFLSDAYCMLGFCYENEGRLKEARDIFNKITEDKAAVYVKIGDFYKSGDNFSEAVSYYRLSLTKQEADAPRIHFAIAECLEELGKFNEAVQEYSCISEGTILLVKGMLRCGKIYESQEQWQSAIGVYEKIAALGVEESKFALERITVIKDKYLVNPEACQDKLFVS